MNQNVPKCYNYLIFNVKKNIFNEQLLCLDHDFYILDHLLLILFSKNKSNFFSIP